MAEIENDVSLRPEFATMEGVDIRRASRIFASNGIHSRVEFRDAPRRNRDYPGGGSAKPGIPARFRLLPHLFDNSPLVPRNAPPNQRADIEQLCVPRYFPDYTLNLPGLSAVWMMGQAMINTFLLETARAAAIPPYTP